MSRLVFELIAARPRASYGDAPRVKGEAMSILDAQDQGYSSQAAFDSTREDRALAARNLMLGQWAAGRMGLKDGEAYARAVAKPGHEPPTDEDVLRKVSRDLADSGLAISLGDVHAKMEEFLAQARAQLEIDDKRTA
jgi:hypothetical protein